MEFTITWRELLVALGLATLIYLLEYVIFSRRRQVPPAEAVKSPDSDSLVGLRAELAELRRRVDALEGAQRRVDPVESQVAGDRYAGATRYATQGMEAEEIAALCGISRDEAALIVALQRKGRDAR